MLGDWELDRLMDESLVDWAVLIQDARLRQLRLLVGEDHHHHTVWTVQTFRKGLRYVRRLSKEPVMSTLVAQTYVPDESTSLAEVHGFLEAHAERRGEAPKPRYLLVGAGEGEQVELPRTVYQVLVQVVAALAAGKAVTVSPTEPQLTTQQAADLLGVSRPTVVRLIESGELVAERIGNRRRLLLGEVLAYRERRRARQYAFLAATAVDLDDEDNPAEMIERLREARRRAAGERQG
jgi:excisionase family DNA binding protein